VVTELLQNLVTRGLRVEQSMLFVIDGGKAIRKALRDVFGDRAIVQRCQVHKARNVRDHLPESRRSYVAKQMRDAYNSTTATTAKKKLMQLASWLESNGEDSAAASLREGLDETLTVMRLALPATLRRTFATTNAIENMNGSLRRVTRNVKRWKDEAMIRRWVALGIAEAQRGFRRVKGHVNMPLLVAALRPGGPTMAFEKKVA
jgi:putative transposase